jgi:hypothetical protein
VVLLTMRPVVFVGFSVEDPAFRLMLGFVHEDFELSPQPPAHIAILPSPGEEEEQCSARLLGRFGVLPVFYPVLRDGAGNEDHGGLSTLVEELGAEIGIASSSPC